jgi:hypothetical protein
MCPFFYSNCGYVLVQNIRSYFLSGSNDEKEQEYWTKTYL